MDPNATYDAMTAAWRDGRHADAARHAANLRTWFARGGYGPGRAYARYFTDAIYRYYGHLLAA